VITPRYGTPRYGDPPVNLDSRELFRDIKAFSELKFQTFSSFLSIAVKHAGLETMKLIIEKPSAVSGESLLLTATSCSYPRIASLILDMFDIEYNYIDLNFFAPPYIHPKLVLPMLRKEINPFVISAMGRSTFQVHNWCFQTKILQLYYTRKEYKEIIYRLKSFSKEFNEGMISCRDCIILE